MTPKIIRRIWLGLALLLLFSAPRLIHGQHLLAADGVLERDIRGGESHDYQIALREGQYACLIVEQRGVDVTIRLDGFEGNIDISIDNEFRVQGEEKVEVVARAAGLYQLSVKASFLNAPRAQYSIRVVEMRAATENDRSLQEARMLLASSRRAIRDAKYEDARLSSERALSITENILGPQHPSLSNPLHQLSDYYEEKEDFAKTIELRERAGAILEKAFGDEHPLTANSRRALAIAYLETNEVVKAERIVRRALEVVQKQLGQDHFLAARCLLTLARSTRDTKRLDYLNRALTIGEKTVGPDHLFVGNVLTWLGLYYLNTDDHQQAEQYLLRSKAVNEKNLGPENISFAVSLNNFGIIARQRKDYVTAERCYREAIVIIEKAFGPENSGLAPTFNNIANIYRAKGEYAKSIESHLRALRIWEATKGPYHPTTLLSLGNLAKTYAARGSLSEAIAFQERADKVIERNIGLNLAIGSERQKLAYLNSIAERTDRTISLNADLAPLDPSATALAALVLLQRKGRVLDAMSESFAALRRRSNAEEQSLIEQFNKTTADLARLVLNGPQTLTYQEHQKKILELEEEKERLERNISRRSAEFRAYLQVVTLSAIQAAIPAQAALIEFAIYRPFDPKAESNSEAYQAPRYVAYVIRQREGVGWCDLGDAKAIDDAIERWRRALRDPKQSDVRQLSRAVDEKVMRPVRALIGNTNQLLLSPDGALNLIPFEALLDEEGRFLIERYSASYLTSGRDLLRLGAGRQSQGELLVMAAPSFGEPPKAGASTKAFFASLEETAQEARAIKHLFPEARVVTGEGATESVLKSVERPRIVHIATHGFFLRNATNDATNEEENRIATRAMSSIVKTENPLLRSGLAFSGANLNRAAAADDGILTALEASGLNLWATKLVTLSACDTGLGEVENGEGVYGFRRAFLLAGAETLVMSLWPVSDYVTREMMTAYYEGLRRNQGRGEALRQVKLNMLKRKDRRHPFYWASFIQAGEWASLDGNR